MAKDAIVSGEKHASYCIWMHKDLEPRTGAAQSDQTRDVAALSQAGDAAACCRAKSYEEKNRYV